MPEEFEYIKTDPYEKYKIHIPIYSHSYKRGVVAGKTGEMQFEVSLETGFRNITIPGASFVLIGNISRDNPMVVSVNGPIAIPLIQRTERNNTKIQFNDGTTTYTSSRKEYHGILSSAAGEELARITTAWKDSDAAKNVKFWLHSHEPIPNLAAALFFCLAQTQELHYEDGLDVSY
jgi:hypothetical protein